MLKKLLLAAAFASSLFAYNMADVNINGSDLQVSATTAASMSKTTTAFYTLSYLSVEDENEREHTSLYGDMLLSGKKGGAIDFGLGFRAQYFDLDYANVDSFICFPLRGKIYFNLPVKAVKTILSAELAYAPEVLVLSSDVQSTSEIRFELNFEVMENGFAYFGFRDIELKPDGGGDSLELNDQASFLGLKIEF